MNTHKEFSIYNFLPHNEIVGKRIKRALGAMAIGSAIWGANVLDQYNKTHSEGVSPNSDTAYSEGYVSIDADEFCIGKDGEPTYFEIVYLYDEFGQPKKALIYQKNDGSYVKKEGNNENILYKGTCESPHASLPQE